MKRVIESSAIAAAVLFCATSAGAADKTPKGGDDDVSSTAASMPGGQSTQGGWMKAGASECIAGHAKEVLNACPAGAIKRSGRMKGGAAFLETDVNQPGKEK